MLFQVFLLSIILGFIIGFLVGGFIEWDKATQVIKELKSDLRVAYRETDDLSMRHSTPVLSLSVRLVDNVESKAKGNCC